MKYISMILLCLSVVLTGVNAVNEERKKKTALEKLSVFFGEMAETVGIYGFGIREALSRCAEKGLAAGFTFPSDTVERYGADCTLREAWKLAAEKDSLLQKTGKENMTAVKELSLHFEDAVPESFAASCCRLSERFESERGKTEKSLEKNGRLILSGAFFGAAALFIIMI